MNNKLIRLIALMLVSLMLLFAVVACDSGSSGGDESNDNGSEQGGPSNSGNPSGTDETTFEQIGVPDGLDYGNTISILYWSDVQEPEFEVKDVSLDHTLQAIYERNQNTVQKLGLNADEGGIVWTPLKGRGNTNMTEFAKHVGTSYTAGNRDYDIVATYSRTAALCAINGYLADIAAIEDSHIDLTRTWWTPSLVETVTIDDSIYFLSGDISTNTIHMMYTIFCNTEMVKTLNLEDPVKLAVEGKWTLDKFMGLCEGVFAEQNDDGAPSSGDRFGFVTTQGNTEAFYNGADLFAIETDDTEVLVISDDMIGNKASKLVNELTAFYQTIDVRGFGNPAIEFTAEHALFTQYTMRFAQSYLSKVQFKYAALPTPKYEEKQVGYRTAVSADVSLWGIMKDVENDPDMLSECSAVLETLAYYGYRFTTPQIFETNLKVKYSDTDDLNTVKCFDLIREGVVYDLGYIFPNTELGDYVSSIFARCIAGKDDWASVKNANKTMLGNKLEEIVEKIDEHKYK